MTTEELKQLIDGQINKNGQRAITGLILNGVLNSIVDTLAGGADLELCSVSGDEMRGRYISGENHQKLDDPNKLTGFFATLLNERHPRLYLKAWRNIDGDNYITMPYIQEPIPGEPELAYYMITVSNIANHDGNFNFSIKSITTEQVKVNEI